MPWQRLLYQFKAVKKVNCFRNLLSDTLNIYFFLSGRNVLSALDFLECHSPPAPWQKKEWHSHIAPFEKKEWHSLIALSRKECTLLALFFFLQKCPFKEIVKSTKNLNSVIWFGCCKWRCIRRKKYIKDNAIFNKLIWKSISTKLVSF